MENFKYLITSSVDRNNLSCEIYYQGDIIAEISQETPELLIEIFAPPNKQWWQISLQEFENALAYAKNHLKGKNV